MPSRRVRKGTLCRLLGLRPSNLAYWIDEGLVETPARDGYSEPQAVVLATLVALTDHMPLQSIRTCWPSLRSDLARRILRGDWYLIVEAEGSDGQLAFGAPSVAPACAHGRPVRVVRLEPYLEKVSRSFHIGPRRLGVPKRPSMEVPRGTGS